MKKQSVIKVIVKLESVTLDTQESADICVISDFVNSWIGANFPTKL